MGYETIQDAINYELAISTLVIIIFAKIMATSFSIGSGGAGGDMVPSLYIGAALGGLLGTIAMQLFPNLAVHPALYVIAGMGAMYSSVAKVPMATAILLSETTRNFSWIVPLITANTVGFLASSSGTIYESQHADASAEKKDILKYIKVKTIMQRDFITVSPDISTKKLIETVRSTEHHGYPVIKDDKLVGVVSWHDTRQVPLDKREQTLVAKIMTKKVISVTPDNQVKKTLALLDKHKIGRIIVVEPKDKNHVVGIVTRRNIIETYMKITES
jgi:CIC family chloride channel protein